MFEDILDFYKEKHCEHVVVTSDVAFIFDSIPEEKKSGLTINVIDDARSATFFAYGQAKIFQTPVVFVVGNQYLTNCYTGLTETWFQQIPLIVISLAEDEKSIYYDYLTPCICKGLTIKVDELENYKSYLEEGISAFGPTLFNLVVEFPHRESNSCVKILKLLNSSLGKDDTVICYGNISSNYEYNFKIHLVNENNKYGIISKYMGYLLGCGGNCYLVAPLELFKYDTNIFNNRYISTAFKVIFVNSGYDLLNPKEWIKNNEIECRNINALEPKVIAEFTSINKPMVLILNDSREE